MKKLFCLASLMSMMSCAAMVEAPKVQQRLSDREFISLAEAIMSGDFKAWAGQIEYVDFEANLEKPPHKTYSCPISLANKEIYAGAHAICTQIAEEKLNSEDCSHPLSITTRTRSKLLADHTISLSDKELRADQTLRLHGFMSLLELRFEKMIKIKKIYRSAIPDSQKEVEKKLVKEQYDKCMIQHGLYKAALASQDESAINEERIKDFRMGAFESLAECLTKRRERAKQEAEDRRNPLGGCQRAIQ